MPAEHGQAYGTFRERATEALADKQLRGNFRRAMDGLMGKRAAQFADANEWQNLRDLGESVRKRTLEKLPELLEQLEENCTKNGIQVHWAETTDEANQIVLEILQKRQAKTVVKGKSMVSEEMHLNHFLAGHGIKALEADLGEYIVQLAEQTPSHIIMPAIHMNRRQIADLFKNKIEGFQYTEDAKEMTAAAREVLRREFAEADAGLSGVNMAVAETGSIVLVENEGNGRMVTTVPPVHIAVTGIDKIVENFEDTTPILSLLPRSATGQDITTYVNVISSPRKPGEKDGPEEVHLVLLDNGRTRIYADTETRNTLQCIRCGACMNHCPVYTRVGGHAYGGIYPGPIGKILTPQIEGLGQYGDLSSASTLCNACVEVCPVKIPIAQVLVRLRDEKAGTCGRFANDLSTVKGAGAGTSVVEDMTWKGWSMSHSSKAAYSLMTSALSLTGNALPKSAPLLKEWTSVRAKPKFASKSLHRMVKKLGVDDE
jgi:L-lactate dehydrogenase complex protein LldF